MQGRSRKTILLTADSCANLDWASVIRKIMHNYPIHSAHFEVV